MPTSLDGVITAEASVEWGYVMLRAEATTPRVRFWRRVNGMVSVVRSGDTARVVGGVAVACDTEAPVGMPVSYWAESDELSDEVEVVVPDLGGQAADTWLKSVGRPSTSTPVWVQSWTEFATTARQQVSWVIGRRDPVIESDARTMPASTLVVATWSRAERDAVIAAADSGVVLLQPPAAVGRDEVYAVVGDISERQVGNAADQQWQITLPLQHVTRPATAGARLLVPGKAYLDNPDLSVGSYLDNLLEA